MPQEVGDLTELVAAARSGDHEAFEELVRVTYADTYTLAYRLTGDEEDARDVVQESYVKAFRALQDGQFDARSRVETWLHRIVVNAALMRLDTGTERVLESFRSDQRFYVALQRSQRPAGPQVAVRGKSGPQLAHGVVAHGPFLRHRHALEQILPSGRAAPDPGKYQQTIIGGFTDAFHFYPVIIHGSTATLSAVIW